MNVYHVTLSVFVERFQNGLQSTFKYIHVLSTSECVSICILQNTILKQRYRRQLTYTLDHHYALM